MILQLIIGLTAILAGYLLYSRHTSRVERGVRAGRSIYMLMVAVFVAYTAFVLLSSGSLAFIAIGVFLLVLFTLLILVFEPHREVISP